MASINERIAKELNCATAQVAAAVELLGEGATVPFIARYRKEKTGGLDDTQLRKLEERLGYLRELEDRRETVIKSITEQGKMTPELQRSISGADSKVELEDIYAPYKPKRRTKAQIAREAGLEPLADGLIGNPALDPNAEAAKFIDAGKGVADAKAALDGARAILIERMGENAKLVGELREFLWTGGEVRSKVLKGKETEGAKFSDYFDFGQAMKDMPSHRVLALLRGRNEGVLDLDLDVAHEEGKPHPAELKIMSASGIARQRPSCRPLAVRYRAHGVAHETAHLAGCRSHGAHEGARRHGRHRRVQAQSERPAAGRTRRPARDHGARSRHPHGRARSPSSMPPASCSTRRPFIRMSRATIGRVRSQRSARCASSTRSR